MPKLHQLKGTIQACWPGKVTSKGPHQHQPFYCLEIEVPNFFTTSQTQTLYVFPNLVSKELWTVLELGTFKNKTYLFFYEKRVRGWRLKDWEEVSDQ